MICPAELQVEQIPPWLGFVREEQQKGSPRGDPRRC